MHVKLATLLALLPSATLTLSALIREDWPPTLESLKAGHPIDRRARFPPINDPGFAPPNNIPAPNLHNDDGDVEDILKRQATVAAGPNLAQNFAILMIDTENPNHALDYWGDSSGYYWFTLRNGQITLIDDGSSTIMEENKFYSFVQGYNEFVSAPSSGDKWTMDTKNGDIARNGQRVFAWCYSELYPLGIGMQATSGAVCGQFDLVYRRVKFRAVNRSSMVPSRTLQGSFPIG